MSKMICLPKLRPQPFPLDGQGEGTTLSGDETKLSLHGGFESCCATCEY